MMVPRTTIPVGLTLALLAAPFDAEAQAPPRVVRIGWLTPEPRPADLATDSKLFRQTLLALGWVEGQHYVLEYRFADGVARLPTLAAELVALPVDLIVAVSTKAGLAAKTASPTVPIVFDNSVDPVAGGLVDSLAHPGGNVTGYTGGLYTDKLFQILKEAVPGMSRIGLLCGCTEAELQRRAFLLAAARSVGVQVQYVDVKDSTRLARSLASTVDGRIGGLVVPPIAWMAQVHYEQIADFATTHRLPTISWYKRFAEVGGLLSYGSKLGQAHPRMAALVDKILRGAKPADLPVEQPTKFEFVINLKTAKRLGLTIPPSVLARADEVIQ